jgi:uncharacterized protein YndB with AHSA1/START domain
MTVVDVRKDAEALTLTFTCEYDAPVTRVWGLWADPRQLERWWGPPTHPATVVEHDLVPGGRVSYYMTSPEGQRYWGWWTVTASDAPMSFSFEDGFGDEHGAPVADMPVTVVRVGLAERDGGGTRMTIESVFPSIEAMQKLTEMGMEEGMRQALGQTDDILAATVA